MKLRLTTTLTVLRDVLSNRSSGLSNGWTEEVLVSITGDVEPGLEGLDVDIVQVDDGRAGDLVEQPEDLTFMESWQAEDHLREQYIAATAEATPREDAA